MSEKRIVRLHDCAMPQRELTAEERLAVWQLIPQLRHRQHAFGAHAPVVYQHQGRCATYTGGRCNCARKPELALPGKN
jgi:hypothetical protein